MPIAGNTKEKMQTMKTNIGIPNKDLQSVANLLNTLLADEVVLYLKTRNYHWNVEGSDFASLHAFFESQYEQLDDIMDRVAERIRQLGHYALGSMKSFGKAARLTEGQDESSASKMVQNLLFDHETLIRQIRNELKPVIEKYDDSGSGDFLTGLLLEHEKMAWMLRAHIR